jgi:hypothetical protein
MILNMRDLTSLQMVAEAAERSSRVSWLDGDDVREGTARSIGDQRGNFLRTDEDVRDGFLRITSVTGFDYFLPVTQVMIMVREGEFAAN